MELMFMQQLFLSVDQTELQEFKKKTRKDFFCREKTKERIGLTVICYLQSSINVKFRRKHFISCKFATEKSHFVSRKISMGIDVHQSQFSGAYSIRNLMKNLTQDRKLMDSTPKTSDNNEKVDPQSMMDSKGKRARRKTSRNKPSYQTKLVNTSEARREIAMALKFHHDASGKPTVVELPSSIVPPRRNLRIYPSNNKCQACVLRPNFHRCNEAKAITSCGHLLCRMCLTRWLNFSSTSNPSYSSTFRECWVCSRPLSSNEVIPISEDRLNQNHKMGTLTNSTSISSELGSCSGSGSSSIPMHIAMDEEEMAEIKLLGEQHEMEWDDMVSFLTSVKWFEFLEKLKDHQDFDG